MSIVPIPPAGQSPGANEAGTVRDSQLRAAAEQFEALFLQQVLKQMRKAGDVLAADNSMRSRELNTMRDFYDGMMAETLAGQKQMGIADMLVQQMGGSTSAAGESAQAAPRSASLAEPLRDTWQRKDD